MGEVDSQSHAVSLAGGRAFQNLAENPLERWVSRPRMGTSLRAMSEAIESNPAVVELAEQLVGAGRVVPGLTVDDEGRGRSWWWPLPAAHHRAALIGLLDDTTVEVQSNLADALAAATDDIVRRRLVDNEVSILPPRPGRRSVPEAWVRSLCESDPWLSPSLAPDRVRGLAADVERWVSTGAALPRSVEVCLRIAEPTELVPGDGVIVPEGSWRVEVLVRDTADTALMAPLGSLMDGAEAIFAPRALEDGLAGLASAVRVAPELAAVFGEERIDAVEMAADDLLEFVRQRSEPLDEVGVQILTPAWWSSADQLGMRAKSSSSSSGAGSGAFGLEELVEFSWEVALGDEVLSEADVETLAAAAAAKRSLVQFRGQWVQLDPARIEAIVARLAERAEATAGELLRAGLGIDALGDDDIDVTGVDDSGWLGDLLRDASAHRVDAIERPPGFAGTLRPYQQRGVGWLTFLGSLGLGACLADDMGLGKTAQMIGSLLAGSGSAPSLVICPVSVLGNWDREIARFAPELTTLVHHGAERERDDVDAFCREAAATDVVLSTYSLLHRDRELLAAVEWDAVVLDEAQQIKNPSTKAARTARSLRAGRRVALTGTPVENHLGELWSIMSFLNPGLLGSATSFRDRFTTPIRSGEEGGDVAADLLGRVTAPFVLRRLKSDRSIITDLPDKIESVASCPLTREQVSLYQAVADDLISRADKLDGIERRGLVLAGISKLKQVCNHPSHFLGDGSAMPRRSGKLERCEQLIDELGAAGDKALIFTQYTAWGDRLGPYLEARFGVPCWWLHGGLKRSSRDELVDEFSALDGPGLMLLSLKAGGTGLNLTAASHVIHYDRWWNPAVEDQATDRAYRIGQTRMVQVHKLVSAGTIEERIDSVIADKKALADRVIGTGEDWLTELTTDELRSVVKLSAEATGG